MPLPIASSFGPIVALPLDAREQVATRLDLDSPTRAVFVGLTTYIADEDLWVYKARDGSWKSLGAGLAPPNVTLYNAPGAATDGAMTQAATTEADAQVLETARQRENHQGTQEAATISDFAVSVRGLLDAYGGALQYDLSKGRFILPNVAEGADGYLAYNDYLGFAGKQNQLGYVPANRAGDYFTGPVYQVAASTDNPQELITRGEALNYFYARTPKNSVKCCTTGNVLLFGEGTHDNVQVFNGQRVMVPFQNNPAQNGIYVVRPTAWERAPDADSWLELVGATVSVSQGSTKKGKLFISQTVEGGNLGTTAITFAEQNGVSYVFGAGFNTTGTTVTVDVPVIKGLLNYTTDEVPAGATNKYFSAAAVLATQVAGYLKSGVSRAIAVTDPLLTVLGILEKKADDNASSLSGKADKTSNNVFTAANSFTGGLDAGGQRITSVLPGVGGTDAATVSQTQWSAIRNQVVGLLAAVVGPFVAADTLEVWLGKLLAIVNANKSDLLSRLNYRGTWQANTAYGANDLVFYQNSFYFAIAAIAATAIFSTTSWTAIGNTPPVPNKAGVFEFTEEAFYPQYIALGAIPFNVAGAKPGVAVSFDIQTVSTNAFSTASTSGSGSAPMQVIVKRGSFISSTTQTIVVLYVGQNSINSVLTHIFWATIS